jgi:hypothetical protein
MAQPRGGRRDLQVNLEMWRQETPDSLALVRRRGIDTHVDPLAKRLRLDAVEQVRDSTSTGASGRQLQYWICAIQSPNERWPIDSERGRLRRRVQVRPDDVGRARRAIFRKR